MAPKYERKILQPRGPRLGRPAPHYDYDNDTSEVTQPDDDIMVSFVAKCSSVHHHRKTAKSGDTVSPVS